MSGAGDVGSDSNKVWRVLCSPAAIERDCRAGDLVGRVGAQEGDSGAELRGRGRIPGMAAFLPQLLRSLQRTDAFLGGEIVDSMPLVSPVTVAALPFNIERSFSMLGEMISAAAQSRRWMSCVTMPSSGGGGSRRRGSASVWRMSSSPLCQWARIACNPNS
jgi:hypothetical protein